MGLFLSKPAWRDPMDLSRPVDVPCATCGAFNYIEERRSRVKCFRCKAEVTRADFGANGLESSGEYATSQKEADDRETHQGALSTMALGLAAGAS